MSELTVSDEEKAAATYLEWDDAALGRFTKHVALTLEKIKDDADGLHRVTTASAAMLLVGSCIDCNAGTLRLEFTDFTHGGEPAGDWLITVKKKPSNGHRR